MPDSLHVRAGRGSFEHWLGRYGDGGGRARRRAPFDLAPSAGDSGTLGRGPHEVSRTRRWFRERHVPILSGARVLRSQHVRRRRGELRRFRPLPRGDGSERDLAGGCRGRSFGARDVATDVKAWVERAVTGIAAYYGVFPTRRTLVVVVPGA